MEPKTGVDPRSLLEHRGFVRAVARGLLADEHAVDDIVQETCLRALERPPRHAHVRAWLARVGRNLALTSLRGERRRGHRERAAARPECLSSASDTASKLEQHRLVVEAVLALEEPFRSAILLRFYEDLPPKEIARQLGVPVDTVRSRLRRGLLRLRAWFDERHGGDRAAWSLALLPLLGAREAAAAAAAATATGGGTKVLLVEGAVMSAKGKLIGAAIVLFAAAAGIVTWQATSARSRPATARTELRPNVPAEEELPPKSDAAVARGEAMDPIPDRGVGVPGQAPRQPVLGRGRGSTGPVEAAEGPARPKPYRIAEPSGEADLGALRVIVTDGAGSPVPGAKIYAGFVKDGRVATTNYEADAAGRLELRSLEPGRWSVSAMVLGQHRIASVEVQAGRFTEIEFALVGGATVEGQVRHLERGPLDKVALRFDREDGGFHDYFNATTDAEGRYRIEGVPPGTYPVRVEGGFVGYEQRPLATIVVPGPGTVVQDIVLGRVMLSGTVRDADTGTPIGGARITFQGPWWGEVTTDAAGKYEVKDLMPENYKVCINRDGYGILFKETGPVPADGTGKADFALRRAAVLVLEVLDADGRPVVGRFVLGMMRTDSAGSVGTDINADENGIARYARIVPGTYDISVYGQGYVRQSQRLEVGSGENRLTFRLERDPAAATTAGKVSLKGVVRDSATKRPIAGVRVNVQSAGAVTTTDADGKYELRKLPPGKWTIHLSRDGYAFRYVREVEVTEEARNLDFELDPAATLHVEVTDKTGRPVVGRIFLGVHGKDENLPRYGTSVETDAEGRGTYRQIAPGRYELRLMQSGVGETTVEVQIIPGENVVRARLE